MGKPAIDPADAVARLSALTTFELRGAWRRHHRMAPPMRPSRDLLIRGIAYKLQERARGGLSKATIRKIERAGAERSGSGAAPPVPPIILKPGTRLVREWRGVTHSVLLVNHGVVWRGRRFRSLSEVARRIARQQARVAVSTTRQGDARSANLPKSRVNEASQPVSRYPCKTRRYGGSGRSPGRTGLTGQFPVWQGNNREFRRISADLGDRSFRKPLISRGTSNTFPTGWIRDFSAASRDYRARNRE